MAGRYTTAFLTPERPRVWDVNLVRVERLPRITPARAIATEAEELLGGAELAHRRVVCDDEALGQRLGPGLTALGWKTEVLLVLAWAGGEPPPAPRLEWADGDALRDAYRASQAGWGTAPPALEQVVDHAADPRTSPGIRLRRAAIRVDGTWAAMLKLFDDGRTAEIDDVATLGRFRGHGLARELVHGAVAAAHAAGCDLVFLRADERDWPAAWYARLGFRPLSRQYVFTLAA